MPRTLKNGPVFLLNSDSVSNVPSGVLWLLSSKGHPKCRDHAPSQITTPVPIPDWSLGRNRLGEAHIDSEERDILSSWDRPITPPEARSEGRGP